jgi:hypothetical protein
VRIDFWVLARSAAGQCRSAGEASFNWGGKDGKCGSEFLSSNGYRYPLSDLHPLCHLLPWPRSSLVVGISTTAWGCDPLRHGHMNYFILRSTANYTDMLCFVYMSSSTPHKQAWRRCDTCGNSRTRFRMHAARYCSYLKAQMPTGRADMW